MAWYDTLGFPDTKDLPYVRVITGGWRRKGSEAPEKQCVEGFLLSEDANAFTVFLCSVSQFKDVFDLAEQWYPPLSTERFVRSGDKPIQPEGDIYLCTAYETEDFTTVATDALARVREQAIRPNEQLTWGRWLAHQARIFAFARACQQKGLDETASALMNIAANLPDRATGEINPGKLRESLQRQIGDSVLARAEGSFGNAVPLSWPELLKPYEDFGTRYPANTRIAYAQEAATVLRRAISLEAKHQPKPIELMSFSEQAAEAIDQLQNLHQYRWTMYTHYPGEAYSPDRKRVITPVERLVDLGDAAIPPLIEALEDRRFTRTLYESHNGLSLPRALRVSEVAKNILEHLSGRNFYPLREGGKLVHGTTRQQAEAWWAERQCKGERQLLIEQTAAGGIEGCTAARKLVEKYPDAGIDAIEVGFRATNEESFRRESLPADILAANVQGTRSEYVEIAGSLPGERPLPFLKAQLVAPGNGLLVPVRAAEALFDHHQPEAVPAMIATWQNVQPMLVAKAAEEAKSAASGGEEEMVPAQGELSLFELYDQVGAIITFLAR